MKILVFILSMVGVLFGHPSKKNSDDMLIEYIEGDSGSKIILTAPHGGRMPLDIPIRINGCIGKPGKQVNSKGCYYTKDSSCATTKCKIVKVTDSNTDLMILIASKQIEKITGKKPHVIISHIKRDYLDPNRDILEAAQSDPLAMEKYMEFHTNIENAKRKVGTGILFDFHGQGHTHNSTEVGYTIKKNTLNLDIKMNLAESSIKALSERNKGVDFLADQERSFGSFLEREGYKAFPSPRQPKPGNLKYFSGGYITKSYGSRFGGNVDAIQLEMPYTLRKDKEVRDKFAIAVGKAIAGFVLRNY